MAISTFSLLSIMLSIVQFVMAESTTVPTPTNTQSLYITPTSAAVDNDAGASGTTESSIGLSKGGLVAIVVIVAVVAIFGVVSTILFFVAKRRQWNIRASISRASRRLTGRSVAPRTEDRSRSGSRKLVVVDATSGRSGVKAVRPPGQKRPLVVEVRDLEKGNVSSERRDPLASTEPPKTNPWLSKLKGNDWK